MRWAQSCGSAGGTQLKRRFGVTAAPWDADGSMPDTPKGRAIQNVAHAHRWADPASLPDRAANTSPARGPGSRELAVAPGGSKRPPCPADADHQ